MLSACPTCQRTFPAEEAGFCPQDATKLRPIDEVAVPPDPQDPYLGHVIAGKYQVRRVIADGGMGRVYEARDTTIEKRIAVKVLHKHIAEDAVNIERFKREAETSRALDHRHIIEVLDFNLENPAPGRREGAWYLVMEFLDGEELRSVIDRDKTVPMSRVVRVIAQAAIALDGAHARGMVHRDLKPDNFFLVRGTDGDRVKILDFGSVKFTKGQDKGQKLTVMGTTLGSPFYMSPEQARGLPDLDHRADVWALGCIIYETAVGTTPFHASNGPQILFKILGEEPMPPSLARDDAPAQLDDVMVRALNKNRDQRYQSCGELADALGHAFGLQGSHLDWAQVPEHELAARMRAAPPPAAQPALKSPAGFPIEQAAPLGAGGDFASTDVPIKKTPVALYAGLAGVLVVLAVIAALALR